ncbi:MAG: glycosyltransferase family 4 protein [Actinomycetota bacterium]
MAVPPAGYGGIEWVVALLADGLVDRGHDVTLFATGDSKTRARLEYVFERAPGSKLINSVWHDAVHQMLVHRDPSRFDLIHQHTAYSGLVASLLLDVPVVHTLHGEFTEEMRMTYAGVADRLWFVAVSEDQRSHMPELRYAAVVYNGVDLDLYPFREDKGDFVLFLGRSDPAKGPLRAVEAAKLAGERLVMAMKIADQHEERHWNEVVQPALADDTEVLGEISQDEKADLLSRAKAVLFPIDWDEPFGLVMAEAMACGTPVIATPRGAAPEVVVDGETGFVVGVEDYGNAAAAALKRLGEIDSRACRKRVVDRFSKETMVSGYEAVFEDVVSRG